MHGLGRFSRVVLFLLGCAGASLALGCESGGSSDAAGDAGADDTSDGQTSSGPGSFTPDYFPTSAWQSKPAEAFGYDQAALDAAVRFAETEGNTEALLIVQDGYLITEAYFRGFSADQVHESFSVAKSFTSGLIGIALGEGLLESVDARLCSFYPEAWDCEDDADPRSRITLHHAMTLTTGLSWTEDWSEGANLLANDAVRMSNGSRPLDYVLQKPSAHEPGTQFNYSTGDPALLSGVLQTATGMNALAFLQDRVLSVIGAESVEWKSDANGWTTTFANLRATAQDYARYGFLYLNRGRWEDQQVIPADWVDLSTRPGVSLEDWYGYLWHVNLPSRFDAPDLPADGYSAVGVSGQYVTVIPSERLVVVRLADDGFATAEFDMAELLRRILRAKQG